MKARIQAGTDIALIGAWDASCNARPLAASANQRAVLEADAAEGHLFLLETHADGGGAIDVYVDQAIEQEVLARLRPVPADGKPFLLAVPTGALLVRGAEDYRAGAPIATTDRSVVRIPPGDYGVRCYAPTDPEREPASEAELRKLVGEGDLAYYDRTNRAGCLIGVLLLLLFPINLFPFGWVTALAITVVVVLAYFALRAKLLERNERYQRLHKVIPPFRLRTEDPWLVLELRRVPARAGLAGGIASL
jgi:hypothetical protein